MNCKLELAIAALSIVISQILSNVYSSNRISNEIVQFKEEMQNTLLEKDVIFITDAGLIIKKMDDMNKQLLLLNGKIKEMLELDSASLDSIIGCSLPQKNKRI